MIIRIATLVLILSAAGCATAPPRPYGSSPPYEPPPQSLWLLIAKSRVIVTGTLSVPAEQIRSMVTSGEHGYVVINVARDTTLKGDPPKHFVVSWFTDPTGHAPNAERVIGLDGKKAMLFLVDDGSGGLYFAGHSPKSLADATPSRVQRVRDEVSAQREIVSNFSEMFPPSGDPLYGKVKRLIDSTTRKGRQAAAFRQLEALGADAVPAIIMLMDDRRGLAIPAITLQNKSPTAFEAVRHYGPQKTVDAMAAILNQITGQNFGTIYSGASERERQATVEGWRIYLHYWRKEAAAP